MCLFACVCEVVSVFQIRCLSITLFTLPFYSISGKNGHVLYQIRENTHKHLLGLYAIDKVSGVVSLKRKVEVRLTGLPYSP